MPHAASSSTQIWFGAHGFDLHVSADSGHVDLSMHLFDSHTWLLEHTLEPPQHSPDTVKQSGLPSPEAPVGKLYGPIGWHLLSVHVLP
jgi:hypothetical protein